MVLKPNIKKKDTLIGIITTGCFHTYQWVNENNIKCNNIRCNKINATQNVLKQNEVVNKPIESATNIIINKRNKCKMTYTNDAIKV